MGATGNLKKRLLKLVDLWSAVFHDHEESWPARLFLCYQKDSLVCYHPAFPDREALVDHWFRARWYLPPLPGYLSRVAFFTSGDPTPPSEDERPAYICEPPQEAPHFRLCRGTLHRWWALLRSHHIVVWKKGLNASPWVVLWKLLGKHVAYVAIDDKGGREYADYCELPWRVLSPRKRRAVNHSSRMRFDDHVAELKDLGLDRAYVFGNGPSLETAVDYDFSNGYSVMCNSVVNNPALLDHVKPHFVVAGDPVNHFGCSAYADKYRQNLFRALDERPSLRLVIPDFHGYVLLANYPQYEKQIFIIPMKAKVVNFDLTREYRIPVFWSVLNALMIPVACTLANEIYTLGCDGMSRNRDNEDFWAHAKGVIDERIDDAHRCHPTFDLHRKSHPEYVRVQLDLAQSVIRAENEHNKRFHAINHSHMALLDARHVDLEKIRA